MKEKVVVGEGCLARFTRRFIVAWWGMSMVSVTVGATKATLIDKGLLQGKSRASRLEVFSLFARRVESRRLERALTQQEPSANQSYNLEMTKAFKRPTQRLEYMQASPSYFKM